MWKANLNRHFAKIIPGLKISAFLILWNALFHSFTLSILLYGSFNSSRISSMNRLSTLNQFLSENQILFAALSSLSALLFFKDDLKRIFRDRVQGLPHYFKATFRGLTFGAALVGALTFNHDYEFLGFTTQLDLNFLASYAWILRAFLIFTFVFSTEFLVKVVLRKSFKDKYYSLMIEQLTLLMLYWIWFNPHFKELMTLTLIFSVFTSFWSSLGFVSAFFILIHAVFGLNFFENEFVGILQFKPVRYEEGIFYNPHLQSLLLVLLIFIYYVRLKLRKELISP